ncbi:MAG: right-handed parallel beta-helix repeat-containing protein [Methanotrichaceae archaeon]|nr:right-handed parallel beta-helix repeat-containing protein [Methanotrichaceae archaeon]
MRTIDYLAYSSLILICSLYLASAETVRVNDHLQAAIDVALPGDTVMVAPGVYDNIEIRKNLNIVGTNSIIRGTNRDACVRILADGINFSGFVVQNGFYGISLENVKNCTINNNTVIHCAQPGIMLKFSDGNTIVNNNASFNGLGGEGWYGIYLTNSNHNLILGNKAFGNGAYGINLFPSCNNNTIKNNVLEANMYGLYMFTDCSDNIIEGNVISRNTNSGIDMRFNCHHNFILNNNIEDNIVAGVTLMDSERNLIEGNDILGNGRYGIQIQGKSDNNIIINNTASESQTGLYIESSGNQIHGNAISENVVQADNRGLNSWYAQYPVGGNLWSDYLGEDLFSGPNQDLPGKDNFGDIPYSIDEEAEDRYPIMGNQVRQIQLLNKSLSSTKVRVGDNIEVKARFQAKYGLSQVNVRAFERGGQQSKAYARMILSGEVYKGILSSAIMDPGFYEIILMAKDDRGYEFKEPLGEVEVMPR